MSWAPVVVAELSDAEAAFALASMPTRVKKGAARDGRKPKFKLTGIASTEHRDVQDDVIHQKGLKWNSFLRRGYFNEDHGRGARDVVGYPTKVYRTSVRANGKSVAATAVEGYLFDTPRAAELARLAIAMDGTNRQMGLSVEGPPPKRSTNDRRDILEAEVEHCAITPWPVNPHTTVNIEMVKGARRLAKSLTASARLERGMRAGGPGDSGPGVLRALMPESGILTQPLAVVDLEAMHNLADGWSPQETLMPPRRLKKAQAVALVREHFPDASDEAVERIIALAQGA